MRDSPNSAPSVVVVVVANLPSLSVDKIEERAGDLPVLPLLEVHEVLQDVEGEEQGPPQGLSQPERPHLPRAPDLSALASLNLRKSSPLLSQKSLMSNHVWPVIFAPQCRGEPARAALHPFSRHSSNLMKLLGGVARAAAVLASPSLGRLAERTQSGPRVAVPPPPSYRISAILGTQRGRPARERQAAHARTRAQIAAV